MFLPDPPARLGVILRALMISSGSASILIASEMRFPRAKRQTDGTAPNPEANRRAISRKGRCEPVCALFLCDPGNIPLGPSCAGYRRRNFPAGLERHTV